MTAEARPAFTARWIVAASGVGIYACAVGLAQTNRTAVGLLAAPVLAVALAWRILARPDRWIIAFLLCAILLPPLPFALGNSGPHPAVLLAALGLFAGLLWLGDWQIRADGLSRAFIAYFCILLASVAPALLYSGLEIAAASLARILLFGISVYVFFYTAYGPRFSGTEYSIPEFAEEVSPNSGIEYSVPEKPRLLFWAAMLSAAFACLDFYFQFPAPAGFGPQFVWLSSGVFRRAQGVFYEASTLGNFCAFFLTMIAVAFSRRTAFSRVGLLAGAAVFSTALIFSYSRGSVLNLAVALATLLVVERARIRRGRFLVISLVSALAGLTIAYFAFRNFFEAYLWRWWGSAIYLFDSPERMLSGRIENWRLLGEYAVRNPWKLLLGVGYKTLPYSNVLGRPVVADNMYFDMLVETGILGFAALLWLNIGILRAGYRAARAADPSTSFFGTWIFCFWAGQAVQMASGDLLTYWRVLPLYFWVLAAAVRGNEPSNRRSVQ